MARSALVAHSAGPQGPGEGSSTFVARLRDALGDHWDVRFPILPDPDDPHYEPWSQALERELASADAPITVVGHSLGGSVALKLLSGRELADRIAGLVLVATPFWGDRDWEAEWALPAGWPGPDVGLPPTHLFHSRDDEEIPFEHLARYEARLPQAVVHPLDGNGHLYDRGELTEIVVALEGLSG